MIRVDNRAETHLRSLNNLATARNEFFSQVQCELPKIPLLKIPLPLVAARRWLRHIAANRRHFPLSTRSSTLLHQMSSRVSFSPFQMFSFLGNGFQPVAHSPPATLAFPFTSPYISLSVHARQFHLVSVCFIGLVRSFVVCILIAFYSMPLYLVC